MSDRQSDAEMVRQHVHKVLAQLRGLREQQRGQGSGRSVEVEREKNLARFVSGNKLPS